MTHEEQAIIDGVELALDWGLPIPEEQYKKYEELIERRKTDEQNSRRDHGLSRS